MRVPWIARRSNWSILKEINPEYSLEELMLRLKVQYCWPPDAKSQLIGKDPDARKDGRQEEKGMTEDEMVGQYHRLDGDEFEQALGDSEGQGSLSCYSPWGHKESDVPERLNHNNNVIYICVCVCILPGISLPPPCILNIYLFTLIFKETGDFPANPVVKASSSNAGGPGFNTWLGS